MRSLRLPSSDKMAEITKLVKSLDTDKSGYISVQECQDFLNKPMERAKEGVQLLLKLAGQTEDGKISVENFAK